MILSTEEYKELIKAVGTIIKIVPTSSCANSINEILDFISLNVNPKVNILMENFVEENPDIIHVVCTTDSNYNYEEGKGISCWSGWRIWNTSAQLSGFPSYKICPKCGQYTVLKANPYETEGVS